MHAAEWIALGFGAVGILINLATLLVGYGVLKGTVLALGSRVATLESELNALSELKLQVAKVETRLEGLVEQVKDLNASIRWMREPAGFDAPTGVTGPRRRVGGGS
jgi:hypothetical protein